MATGSFDYDILTYDVLGQAYADNGSYGSSSSYYDGYYGSSWCCGFSFGISFGSPYYYRPYSPYYGYFPYHYGYYPYHYGYAAYTPFLYYPYYWPASYYPYRPYYGYNRPYHPYYPYYGWGNRPGYGNGYVTPYRFRGNTVIAGRLSSLHASSGGEHRLQRAGSQGKPGGHRLFSASRSWPLGCHSGECVGWPSGDAERCHRSP